MTEGYNSRDEFLREQLITYLGNKRRLVPYIEEEIQKVCQSEGHDQLRILEPFSGSGSVSRLLKLYASYLVVNDLEEYAGQLAECYLASPEPGEYNELSRIIQELNDGADKAVANDETLTHVRLFERYYAPAADDNIQEGERVYYTKQNARRLDWYREQIFTTVPEHLRRYLIAPLIVQSSIHTNTAGTFNSFLKRDGRGHFGGAGENALSRILGEIRIPVPVFTYQPDTRVEVFTEDANLLCERLRNETEEFDLVYLDPPYNKHAYGTFYFMLNIVGQWDPGFVPPDNLRGQPDTWIRSQYNSFTNCETAFRNLIRSIRSRWIILSYNNEGILSEETIQSILSEWGAVQRREIKYPTYRACYNLASRSKTVNEYLWIVRRHGQR